MKKILATLSLIGVAGAMVAGSLLGANGVKETKADGPTHSDANYLTVDGASGAVLVNDSSFFSNWSSVETDCATAPGNFRNSDATYWVEANSFNALDSFFDGCNDGKEGLKYTLRSKKWSQSTRYIYFQWGCARDSITEGNEVEKLVFHFYSSAGVEYTTHEIFNNTFSGVTLVLRNYSIPENIFNHFEGNPFYMSVDLVDGRTGDYGAHVFGYLHVNQTLSQVSDAQWLYYKNCVGLTADKAGGDVVISQSTLRSHYYLNESLRNGFETGFEEQFETQVSFDKSFLKDDYGNDVGERHQNRAISESKYRKADDTNMPFNKTGDGLFKGWYGSGDDDYDDHQYGYVASDDSVYRFVSKPFRLPTNGIVSVKMSGNSASLHLIDFDGGHGDLAWVDRKIWNNVNNANIADNNGRNCTMTRHVINFSKYAGRLVQLAIADVDNKVGGWNAVYFDELKADYDSLPGFKVDCVEQNKDTVNHNWSAIPDIYVDAVEGASGIDYANNDGPATDNSDLKNAYGVWKDYIDNVRGGREGRNYCGALKSEEVNSVLTAYNGLSEGAKRIVCASDDFERVGGGTWYTIQPTIYNAEHAYSLASSLSYLASKNSVDITVYGSGANVTSSFFSEESMKQFSIVASVIGLTLIPVAGLFVFLKRRREQE